MSKQSLNPGVLRLVVAGQVQTDTSFPLPRDSEIVLGRDASCDIVLDAYSMVSRRHAVIRLAPSGLKWIIQDLNSANGIYVNGKRIQCESMLSDRNRIRLAQNGPEFQFEYEAVPLSVGSVQPTIIVEEIGYRIQISPTKLIIELKEARWSLLYGTFVIAIWFSVLLILLGGLTFLLPVLMAIVIYSCFYRIDVGYIFDIETDQLMLLQESVVDRVFSHRLHLRQLALQEFIAVRLQKLRCQDDDHSGYEYNICLDRTNSRPLRLNHRWHNREKAEETVNIINRFLWSSAKKAASSAIACRG